MNKFLGFTFLFLSLCQGIASAASSLPANRFDYDSSQILHVGGNILTGENTKIINMYQDEKAQSLTLLYEDGMVVIFNEQSGNIIGINPATGKMLIEQPDGKIILEKEAQ